MRFAAARENRRAARAYRWIAVILPAGARGYDGPILNLTPSPMTDEQFEFLVARLEQEQARNPLAYRRKVLALAFAGYAYIAAVLLLAVLLLLGSLAIAVKAAAAGIKLAIVFGAFLWMVVRAMWVKLDPPEGREVTRQEAPELFALLDQLQRELKVRARFHHVLITDDFNAAVVQTPRLGILD